MADRKGADRVRTGDVHSGDRSRPGRGAGDRWLLDGAAANLRRAIPRRRGDEGGRSDGRERCGLFAGRLINFRGRFTAETPRTPRLGMGVAGSSDNLEVYMAKTDRKTRGRSSITG